MPVPKAVPVPAQWREWEGPRSPAQSLSILLLSADSPRAARGATALPFCSLRQGVRTKYTSLPTSHSGPRPRPRPRPCQCGNLQSALRSQSSQLYRAAGQSNLFIVKPHLDPTLPQKDATHPTLPYLALLTPGHHLLFTKTTTTTWLSQPDCPAVYLFSLSFSLPLDSHFSPLSPPSPPPNFFGINCSLTRRRCRLLLGPDFLAFSLRPPLPLHPFLQSSLSPT